MLAYNVTGLKPRSIDFLTASITSWVVLLVSGHLGSGRPPELRMSPTSLANSCTISVSCGRLVRVSTSSGIFDHPIWSSAKCAPVMSLNEAESSWYGITKSVTWSEPEVPWMRMSMAVLQRKEQWNVATLPSSQCKEAAQANMMPDLLECTAGSAVADLGSW